jgi:hypothetical protein
MLLFIILLILSATIFYLYIFSKPTKHYHEFRNRVSQRNKQEYALHLFNLYNIKPDVG